MESGGFGDQPVDVAESELLATTTRELVPSRIPQAVPVARTALRVAGTLHSVVVAPLLRVLDNTAFLVDTVASTSVSERCAILVRGFRTTRWLVIEPPNGSCSGGTPMVVLPRPRAGIALIGDLAVNVRFSFNCDQGKIRTEEPQHRNDEA